MKDFPPDFKCIANLNAGGQVLKGKRVTVMGLGLFGGGVGIARWLNRIGARVTVTDLRKPAELKESLESLAGFENIKYRLGSHNPDDFAKTDLVVVNPAVPRNSDYLKIAARHNISLTTESNIFFQVCPAPIIGITGSNGKTTTAALIYEMLKGTRQKIWLGGNIGMESLHNVSSRIKAEDLVVLELSSFQLEDLDALKMSPFVSVVTNISPNHLDRHKTMANYIKSKKSILRYQKESDYSILNLKDKEVAGWVKDSPGKVLFFGMGRHNLNGACVYNNDFYIVKEKKHQRVCATSETRLLGSFNQENIAAALAVASIFSVPVSYLKGVIENFKGVEHRLEFVREIKGVKYYNDSIATNPESTIGAIKAIKGNINLILGGYDKKLPFDNLAKEIIRHIDRVRSVVLLGATAKAIEASLSRSRLKSGRSLLIMKAKEFKQAVILASRIAGSNDTVLLSPACASFDMFRNFKERGEIFKAIVNALAE